MIPRGWYEEAEEERVDDNEENIEDGTKSGRKDDEVEVVNGGQVPIDELPDPGDHALEEVDREGADDEPAALVAGGQPSNSRSVNSKQKIARGGGGGGRRQQRAGQRGASGPGARSGTDKRFSDYVEDILLQADKYIHTTCCRFNFRLIFRGVPVPSLFVNLSLN